MSIKVAGGNEFTERRTQESTMSKTTALCTALVVALSGGAVTVVATHSVTGGITLPTPYRMPDSAGSSSVTLADGRRLELRGGDGSLIVDGRDVFKLATPRRFASLTVMPTGQVLIWGGIDNEGRLIETGEWFEPSTGALVTTGRLGLPVRAGHTLNVLSDGTLAMTGGWGQGNVPAYDVALWRPLDRHLDLVAGDAAHVRLDARASLMADGTLQIRGGVDEIGRPVRDEWRFGVADGLAAKNHGVAATYPSRDKNGASPIGPLALRFADPVDVNQLNGTVSLLGPNGVVKTRVVAAEGGRLAFVQLPDELYPAARYTIFVQGLHTAAGDSVPYEAIGFTTKAARTGVVLAGEGKRPGVPTSEVSGEPPVYVMAGAGKVTPCKPVDAFHLCRNKGEVKDGAFYPGQDNVATASGGHWRLYTNRQTLPDTRERESNLPKGATALIGQVRRIDETPVANVEITVAGQHVRTDAQGVFVLRDLLPGRNELFVDGGPAGNASTEYGRFIVGADVAASTVNHMPYVMYLPRVLARDKIALPSPTTHETVLTHPDMPGLELRIPAGAVFKDRNGKVLTEIAIVPTPVDHAPFPLPDNFPTYFTIQPGDAVVQGMTPDAAKGIQVVYPNYGKQKPADKADFWVYSAQKGWEMYGAGHVTNDASQFVADGDTRLVWALGAGASTNPPKPNNGKKPQNKCAGEPVDLMTGMFTRQWVDLAVSDTLPIAIDRTAGDLDDPSSPFGLGSGSSLNMTISSSGDLLTPNLTLPCGEAIVFDLASGQPNWPLVGTVWKHTRTRSPFYGATLQFLNDSTPEAAHWVVTKVDGTQYWFDRHAPNKLYRQIDRFGNTIQFRYDGGLISGIVSPNGRSIDITHQSNNLIGSVSDPLGRMVTYEYAPLVGATDQSQPVLRRVNYPDGSHEEYTYRSVAGVETRFIESVLNRRGFIDEKSYFESSTSSRVVKQEYADGGTMSFAYETDASGKTTAAVTTDPNGHQERTEFDPVSGYPAREVLAYGTPLAQTRRSVTNAAGQLLSRTDVAGRTTKYSYDSNGKVVSVSRLYGTADQSTFSYTWADNGRIASITDPLGHVTTMDYDRGCLSTATDPTGRQVHFSCDAQGRTTSVADADGHVTRLQYKGGDLVAVSDPVGNTTHFVYDAAGRRVAATNPDGSVIQTTFDANDRPSLSIDANGGKTILAYDPLGNLLSATLPNGSTLRFEYDVMGNRTSYTDAAGHTSRFGYDLKGNLTSEENRKHQVTTYAYNDLDLLVLRTFADGSGTSITYGSNNHPVEALDTISGSIRWTYDAYDRVASETTAVGSVSYLYDLAGRRASMTLANGDLVSYEYDDGNRLTAINDGAKKYSFAYDRLGRRASLAYPNGMSAGYTYDPSGRLLSVNYSDSASNPLSASAYTYDAAGRRVSIAGQGSVALPAASGNDSTFDPSNRVISADSGAYAYDDNGNMTSDGVYGYEWNARGQLTRISSNGVDVFHFDYDALGRRVKKSGLVEKTYVYDGANEVEETVGGERYKLISSPVVDEKLARTSDVSSEFLMEDGGGSIVGVADSQSKIIRQYSYDPYGKTAAVPGASENSYLYTGREMDEPDLYYYRSRYYRPSEGRFISEDTFGLASGQSNFYTYAGNSPLNFTDPSGHCPWCVGAVVGGLIGGVTGYISGGWSGAAAGALSGAAFGAVGGPLGSIVGDALSGALGEIGGTLGGAAWSGAFGATSGAAGTMAGNYSSNKPLFKRVGFGATLGGLAPFMTGEAFATEAVVGTLGKDVFGGLSGLVGGFGGMADPLKDCGDPEYPVPEPDNHFPWPSMNF